eukprot:CAMPEP_0118714368 /NCGR_PEP_ID=MMETSP0800-20121206/26149_1 /TAXON_ID=210618 ORGANISM="Striatella unipunctata, Strain CCMP2910" /NCGR_SAMPLE_ID=MMETSP0800 /ASSEMBLY_ACC=CAM_ASM_000638 /LENGTH=272 /DNA_ID=CAMNT_0006620155 /DNA_START=168 /DNA_END=986 /DNA_ORIENTATION=+
MFRYCVFLLAVIDATHGWTTGPIRTLIRSPLKVQRRSSLVPFGHSNNHHRPLSMAVTGGDMDRPSVFLNRLHDSMKLQTLEREEKVEEQKIEEQEEEQEEEEPVIQSNPSSSDAFITAIGATTVGLTFGFLMDLAGLTDMLDDGLISPVTLAVLAGGSSFVLVASSSQLGKILNDSVGKATKSIASAVTQCFQSGNVKADNMGKVQHLPDSLPIINTKTLIQTKRIIRVIPIRVGDSAKIVFTNTANQIRDKIEDTTATLNEIVPKRGDREH